MLSMFSGFGFDWPPAIRAIYSAFSIVNFNFDLLAPECSLVINFETKWCVHEGYSHLLFSHHAQPSLPWTCPTCSST